MKTNGYSNAGRRSRKERLTREMNERNEYWRSLTPEQQLAILDQRGVAAKKQRSRIATAISASKG
jgi:hypothetical protein